MKTEEYVKLQRSIKKVEDTIHEFREQLKKVKVDIKVRLDAMALSMDMRLLHDDIDKEKV